VALEELAGEREVGLGAPRSHVVENDRHPVAGRLAEAHVAGDDGVVRLLLEEAAHLARHLLPEVGAVVDHGEQDALDVEARVEGAAHAAHRGDQLGKPLEGEVLAVQRDEDRVGGDQRVEREEAERGGAVDEDVVELVGDRVQEAAEALLAGEEADHLDLGAGEVAVGGDDREPLDGGLQDEGRDVAVDLGGGEGGIDGAVGGDLVADADAAGHVGLGVHVDEEDLAVGEGKRGRQVDGGGGFAHAALLVGDSDDPSHRR